MRKGTKFKREGEEEQGKMHRGRKQCTAVSPLVLANLSFLRHLVHCSRSVKAIRTAILTASEEQLLCLVEICFNLLRGRLPADGRRMRRMRRHAGMLRRLARCRCPKSARCLLLPSTAKSGQKGAGIGAIAGLLASMLLPILVEKIHK